MRVCKYCRFFCVLVCGGVGPFHFTYDGSSCPFPGDSRDEFKGVLFTLIRSLTEVLTFENEKNKKQKKNPNQMHEGIGC